MKSEIREPKMHEIQNIAIFETLINELPTAYYYILDNTVMPKV